MTYTQALQKHHERTIAAQWRETAALRREDHWNARSVAFFYWYQLAYGRDFAC
jgi:hypothetical protein